MSIARGGPATADSTRLRFGPYEVPDVKKGDRSFCLCRDADGAACFIDRSNRGQTSA